MRPKIVIITGVSGSGKTTFLKALEDIGFYCMDNLPIEFIPQLIGNLIKRNPSINRFGLVIDVREENFQRRFPWLVEELRKIADVDVIFLDANDSEIIRRFKLLRRKHPLQGKTSLEEALKEERKILSSARMLAGEFIDTTGMSMGALRKKVMEKYGPEHEGQKVNVVSFGFVYGIPQETDLLFDVRALPNPFWVEELRELTGENPMVRDFLMAHNEVVRYMDALKKFLDETLDMFFMDGRRELVISIGCTGGKHRSVFFVEELYNWLKDKNRYEVVKIHRDVSK
ncbi:MAG: RNase adapter RapZ [Candidatus Aminicenantes bacterium]|nr:RNase adapter RapZ [Candidatus Aminicenantes bacterium]